MIICDTRYEGYAILRSDHLNTTSGPFHIKVCWIVGKKAAERRGIRLEFLWWWLVVGPMVGPAISCHRLRFIFVQGVGRGGGVGGSVGGMQHQFTASTTYSALLLLNNLVDILCALHNPLLTELICSEYSYLHPHQYICLFLSLRLSIYYNFTATHCYKRMPFRLQPYSRITQLFGCQFVDLPKMA